MILNIYIILDMLALFVTYIYMLLFLQSVTNLDISVMVWSLILIQRDCKLSFFSQLWCPELCMLTLAACGISLACRAAVL